MHQKLNGVHKRYLFFVCFIAALGGFLFGFDTAVISGTLFFIVKQFHFSSLMEGCFVSSALLGCIIGVAATGKLTYLYGRKKMMLLAAALFFMSAIGCMLATNAFFLIACRLMGGLGIGIASMICPLYISEFSPPSFRGRMVALYQLAITIGIVAAYFSNAFLLNLSTQYTFSGWFQLIFVLALPFFSQVSGINAIIYYGPSILDRAGFSIGHALSGQVTIGIINVLFTFVAVTTVDKWGRKPLLFLGITGAVTALVVIGILFKTGSTEGPWILIFILSFIACFAFSFGPVCWIILGEIFPTAVRGQAMSLATLSLWIANFFVGQMTPVMLKSDAWGPAATFWNFAVLCVPALWMTWKLIPETKGKTLEEIEHVWKTKKARVIYEV